MIASEKENVMKSIEKYKNNRTLIQEKKYSKKISIVVMVLFLLLAFFGIFGNLGTFSSGIKLMYISQAGRDYWSASYHYFDGYSQRKLWVNEDGILEIQVETEEGTLKVSITDEEGNIIFSEENITTQEIEVGDVKKVTVRIDAEKHKGSFSISVQ